ncbi:PREDICTED: RAD9, HUS1, RAD1-interacting nuclear orphan protein 1 isoform X2 [Elephantulus edwardii]|uniref:RAD9, HUS1, RAD1-interacting nuclear orphan protein 1 isoform X2 n=1 Tax=Elephantulus edwardii TaxID=28737 RepID=UPI0003F06A6C|nr:PREDICTED: RAD9, HUS1, RAD1-interacting nuclear orphan protein 1 isoform X2 [Elephantulus edwardii]
MPPRKKRIQGSRKAPLLFHQQPLEGSKHRHGSPQPPSHTRQVLPQFDTAAESGFHAYRKRHHRDKARHSSRKSTTSKFPRLTFESPQTSSDSATLGIPLVRKNPNQSENHFSRKPLVPMFSPQSSGELSVHTLQNPAYMFIPPDSQTPESSPVREELTSPNQRENNIPSFPLHPSTPKSPEPDPILGKDTPEEKYGIQVTWRRQQHLLTCLRAKGKLSRSQFLVKN